MKFVIDSSIIRRWYLPAQITNPALNLRLKVLTNQHELIAPDILLIESTEILAQAERATLIPDGALQTELTDLQSLGITFFQSMPLLTRAGEITLGTKIKIMSSFYIALADQEHCQVLTADPKFLRAARRQFPFVIDLASLP